MVWLVWRTSGRVENLPHSPRPYHVLLGVPRRPRCVFHWTPLICRRLRYARRRVAELHRPGSDLLRRHTAIWALSTAWLLQVHRKFFWVEYGWIMICIIMDHNESLEHWNTFMDKSWWGVHNIVEVDVTDGKTFWGTESYSGHCLSTRGCWLLSLALWSWLSGSAILWTSYFWPAIGVARCCKTQDASIIFTMH